MIGVMGRRWYADDVDTIFIAFPERAIDAVYWQRRSGGRPLPPDVIFRHSLLEVELATDGGKMNRSAIELATAVSAMSSGVGPQSVGESRRVGAQASLTRFCRKTQNTRA